MAIDVTGLRRLAVGDRVELWGREVPVERVAAAAAPLLRAHLPCGHSGTFTRANREGLVTGVGRIGGRSPQAHPAPPGDGVDLRAGPLTAEVADVRDTERTRGGGARLRCRIHTASLHGRISLREAGRNSRRSTSTRRGGCSRLWRGGVRRFVYTSHDLAVRGCDAPGGRRRNLGHGGLVPRPRDIYDETKLAARPRAAMRHATGSAA